MKSRSAELWVGSYIDRSVKQKDWEDWDKFMAQFFNEHFINHSLKHQGGIAESELHGQWFVESSTCHKCHFLFITFSHMNKIESFL